MKFLTYAPAVQKNTIGDANVQRYGSAAAKAIATAGQLGGQAYGNLARSVGQRQEQSSTNRKTKMR